MTMTILLSNRVAAPEGTQDSLPASALADPPEPKLAASRCFYPLLTLVQGSGIVGV